MSSPYPSHDLYKALELKSSATTEEIRASYRRLILIHHPDRAGNTRANNARFSRIQQAYETLSDPESRANYDEFQRSGSGPSSTQPQSQPRRRHTSHASSSSSSSSSSCRHNQPPPSAQPSGYFFFPTSSFPMGPPPQVAAPFMFQSPGRSQQPPSGAFSHHVHHIHQGGSGGQQQQQQQPRQPRQQPTRSSSTVHTTTTHHYTNMTGQYNSSGQFVWTSSDGGAVPQPFDPSFMQGFFFKQGGSEGIE